MSILLIALGGAIGSICRSLLGTAIQTMTHAEFPLGTLTINVVGSLIVGALFGYLMNAQTHPYIRPALVVGFCGGFTTFSTFSMDTVGLLAGGEVVKASFYVVGSVLAGVVAAALGFAVTRPG